MAHRPNSTVIGINTQHCNFILDAENLQGYLYKVLCGFNLYLLIFIFIFFPIPRLFASCCFGSNGRMEGKNKIETTKNIFRRLVTMKEEKKNTNII